MNLNTDLYIENDSKVGLVHNLVERMDLEKLIESYSNKGRKPAVDPITMLQILIFCYSEGIYSSRKIEKACKYDLRVIYLLEDQKAPDHATINRYRKKLEPFIKDILYENTTILIGTGHIDLSSIYIDGTEVEAYANKYTFVWKKTILKFQENLRQKLIEHFNLSELNTLEYIKNRLLKEYNSNTIKQKR